ncbi:MAG TPA: 5-(carboxyamino)imidazole ribonucleotide synthase [Nitrospira sp.]|nr:5-(carboxyamino)imidazole ribonucleotide synthase [Nitrospira sp.]
MKRDIIVPGSVLGVLGGGQLGAMFAAAAVRLGYAVAVWDPDQDAPAHRLARYSFPSGFADQAVLAEFCRLVHVVTYEWENVPADLCVRLERELRVRPASAILRTIQHRVRQKEYLKAHGFPVADFVAVASMTEWQDAVARIGYPAVCKTATAGYDGKGQWRIAGVNDLPDVERAVSDSLPRGMQWVLESLVPFERELSVLIVRGPDGNCRSYPTAENEHEQGMLRTTIVPADIPERHAGQAQELARSVIEQMDGIGVFCVELFQLADGTLLINEIAPRPHNSGHYTLDACTVSQFEQQVRAVCGLPLGEVRLLSPAAMVNIIGDELSVVMDSEGCDALLSVPGAVLHLYGKRQIRPRRKMGHLTVLADRVSAARDKAAEVRHRLATVLPR